MSEQANVTPGAPLLKDAAYHNGERVVARLDADATERASSEFRGHMCAAVLGGFCCPGLLPLWCLCCWPFGMQQRLQDKFEGTRLILTESALHYEVDEHRDAVCCGINTQGKSSRTFPLSSIRDITITAPGGLCASSELPQLTIQADRSDSPSRTIHISSVLNAEEFREAVMAQRRKVVGNAAAVSPISQPAMGVAPAELPLHLKQLADLRTAGSLTEEEFAMAKMKLLA